MSARCPIKVVFNPDLPYTRNEDYFPVSRATSPLTMTGLQVLHRDAWGRYCLSSKGRTDRMQCVPLMLAISLWTKDLLVNRMEEHERLLFFAEGTIAGYQVMLSERLARHDFVNGIWCSRMAEGQDDPLYENAEFEDSLILSPDGKTPLVAIRHHRCPILGLIACYES